jgi:hypothetical protein
VAVPSVLPCPFGLNGGRVTSMTRQPCSARTASGKTRRTSGRRSPGAISPPDASATKGIGEESASGMGVGSP